MQDINKTTKRILGWAAVGLALFTMIKGCQAYNNHQAYEKLPDSTKVVVDSLIRSGKPEEIAQQNIDAYNGIIESIKYIAEEHIRFQRDWELDKETYADFQATALLFRLGRMIDYLERAERLTKETTLINITKQESDIKEAKTRLLTDAEQFKAKLEEILELMKQGKIKVFGKEEPNLRIPQNQLMALEEYIEELRK